MTTPVPFDGVYLHEYLLVLVLDKAEELEDSIEANILDVWNQKYELKIFAGIPKAVSEEVTVDVPIRTRNVDIVDWSIDD